MSGILAAGSFGETERLDAEVTAADFGGGITGYINGAGGSIDDATFVDATGTTRTITRIYGDGATDTLGVFAISGTSIPNTGATFAYIVVGGVRYDRILATYDEDDTGDSSWTWDSGFIIDGVAGNPHSLEVWV